MMMAISYWIAKMRKKTITFDTTRSFKVTPFSGWEIFLGLYFEEMEELMKQALKRRN